MKLRQTLFALLATTGLCSALQQYREDDQKIAAAVTLDVQEDNQAELSGIDILTQPQHVELSQFILEYSCIVEFDSIHREFIIKDPANLTIFYDYQSNSIRVLDPSNRHYIPPIQSRQLHVTIMPREIGNVLPQDAYYALKHYYDGNIDIVDPADQEHIYYRFKYHRALPRLTFFCGSIDFLATIDFGGMARIWDMRFLKTSLAQPQVDLIKKVMQARSLQCDDNEKNLFDQLPECWKRALERAYGKLPLWQKILGWLGFSFANIDLPKIPFWADAIDMDGGWSYTCHRPMAI